MSQLDARFVDPIILRSSRYPTAHRFVEQAGRQGYRIVHQAGWPNLSGWFAMAAPESERVALVVRYYRDQCFTVQICGHTPQIDELLAELEAVA